MRQSEILVEVLEAVRVITNFYFSKTGEADVHKRWKLGDVEFNSIYWIAAHLVWTEHSLLIEGLGGKKMEIPWLEDFRLGSIPQQSDSHPPLKEVLTKLKEVHSEAMKIVRSFSDEELDQPNAGGWTFMGKNSRRNPILHTIRHEPMHIGQLSWILKLNGIKVI